jgi:hypothetical protein
MYPDSVGTLWSGAGILVGFQVTAFTLRINREISVGSSGDRTWLPVADSLNLLSLSTTLIGVFTLPMLDVVGLRTSAKLFGLAVLLLVGYAFALAGHYEMYNPRTGRSMDYFPRQERVAVGVVAVMSVGYVLAALA